MNAFASFPNKIFLTSMSVSFKVTSLLASQLFIILAKSSGFPSQHSFKKRSNAFMNASDDNEVVERPILLTTTRIFSAATKGDDVLFRAVTRIIFMKPSKFLYTSSFSSSRYSKCANSFLKRRAPSAVEGGFAMISPKIASDDKTFLRRSRRSRLFFSLS